MTKRPFFGFRTPKLRYPAIGSGEQEAIREIPLPGTITLHAEHPPGGMGDCICNVGDGVMTGQKVLLTEDGEDYIISTVTGTIADISEFTGYLGRQYTAISIRTDKEDQRAEDFTEIIKAESPASPIKFMGFLPGDPHFTSLIDPENTPDTIVIKGIDEDLLVTANQMIVKNRIDDLAKGTEYLKTVTNARQVLIVVPPDLAFDSEKTGADVRVIDSWYPDALPKMIMKKILGRIVPEGKRCRDVGVGFVSAEAVAALGSLLSQGTPPVNKVLTVLDKDHKAVTVEARIGTPIKEILNALALEVNHGDRLILGGPMTGLSVYSEEMPIRADTDAVMIQDSDQIVMTSDSPCMNCGECVRACPAKIPVNMLVRLLENGLFEEAVDEYDLLSCIECGLCTYVCTARIPVFHYIMLGKYEFDRVRRAEESDA